MNTMTVSVERDRLEELEALGLALAPWDRAAKQDLD